MGGQNKVATNNNYVKVSKKKWSFRQWRQCSSPGLFYITVDIFDIRKGKCIRKKIGFVHSLWCCKCLSTDVTRTWRIQSSLFSFLCARRSLIPTGFCLSTSFFSFFFPFSNVLLRAIRMEDRRVWPLLILFIWRIVFHLIQRIAPTV